MPRLKRWLHCCCDDGAESGEDAQASGHVPIRSSDQRINGNQRSDGQIHRQEERNIVPQTPLALLGCFWWAHQNTFPAAHRMNANAAPVPNAGSSIQNTNRNSQNQRLVGEVQRASGFAQNLQSPLTKKRQPKTWPTGRYPTPPQQRQPSPPVWHEQCLQPGVPGRIGQPGENVSSPPSAVVARPNRVCWRIGHW